MAMMRKKQPKKKKRKKRAKTYGLPEPKPKKVIKKKPKKKLKVVNKIEKKKKRKIKQKKNPKKVQSQSAKVYLLMDQKSGKFYTSNVHNELGDLEDAFTYPTLSNAKNYQADYSEIVSATLSIKK